MKLAEFFVSLGVNADQKKLDKFSDGVSNLDKNLRALKVIAVATAIKIFTDRTIDATVAVDNFTQQTGELGSTIQKLQVAGELSNLTLSAEQITSSLTNFAQNIKQIQSGAGGNVSGFSLLGINPKEGQDVNKMLAEMRIKLRGLEPALQSFAIEQTGLDPQFLNMLKMTNEEFDNLTKNKTFLSKEKRDDVLALGTAFTSLKISMGQIKDQIVALFAPAFTAITKAIVYFAEQIAKLLGNIGSITPVLKALGAGLAVIIALFSPLTMAITGVVLAGEDFYTWLKGGDSLIGRFIKKMQEFGRAIMEHIAEPFKYVKDIIDSIDFGNLNPFSSNDVKLVPSTAGIGSNSSLQAMVNNTFNINSTADPKTLSDNIAGHEQRVYSDALSQMNNGVSN